jgi:2'-5' RNA ligase
MRLHEVVRNHTSGLPGLRQIPEENIHLTLRFLGATPTDRLDSLCRHMEGLATTIPPIALRIVRIRPFPARKPVVVAAQLEVNKVLLTCADGIESIARSHGFDQDERPFRAHITVARVKQKMRRIPDLDIEMDLPFVADEIVLFRSDLSPAGARYSRICASRLEAQSNGVAR